MHLLFSAAIVLLLEVCVSGASGGLVLVESSQVRGQRR